MPALDILSSVCIPVSPTLISRASQSATIVSTSATFDASSVPRNSRHVQHYGAVRAADNLVSSSAFIPRASQLSTSVSTSVPSVSLSILRNSRIGQNCGTVRAADNLVLCEQVQQLAKSQPSPPPPLLEPSLPFVDEDFFKDGLEFRPAEPLLRTNTLAEALVKLPGENVFKDKILPPAIHVPVLNDQFSIDYFKALCTMASSRGHSWPPGTPNYCGARIPLVHTKLNIPRWRHHLIGYNEPEIAWYLQYGFPLGLQDDPPPVLVSAQANHGSSYQFYTSIDKFLKTGVEKCDLVGPCSTTPFKKIHISPLMTAPKKPSSRRPVFDATFGDHSLNNNTPSDHYLGQPMEYAYPRIEDFKRLVLKKGAGCYIWKRDLSRFFLQIPLCPVDYPKVVFVWRQVFYFFAGLMFGLRNSGYQGQRVTNAVTWIHQRLGLTTDVEEMFSSINYSDDIGGAEATMERAEESFTSLFHLFQDLGLEESLEKAHPPSTKMPYLGVEFDTTAMTMSIPPEKLQEVRTEVRLWMKKTTATKKNLQRLLGKLFWVSRCVQHSRVFMGRLLGQLKLTNLIGENKKVKLSSDCMADIEWWDRYLRRFNGVEIMYPADPVMLSLDQLLDTSAMVNCGDAQMMGGGSYFGMEYWSRPFPRWLQDPQIPIHIKEFWVVLASAWLWGEQWRGKVVHIFSDSDPVVDVLVHEKPKDVRMQELLREFLFIVCTRGFTPVFRKIGTKENAVADFISRVHNQSETEIFFKKKNLPTRKLVSCPDNLFTLRSNW